MLYLGMFFNTFVWHVEEHNLYHIKLQQLGVDKTSYIAPLNIVKRLGKCRGEMCRSCKVNHVCLTTSCFNLSYLKPPSIHPASKRCFVIIKVQVPHNLFMTFPFAITLGFGTTSTPRKIWTSFSLFGSIKAGIVPCCAHFFRSHIWFQFSSHFA